MTKVIDIVKIMEDYAPVTLAEQWDNVGLLVGSCNDKVKTVLVALDLDENTVNEAVNVGADVIITHHPILLTPINCITDDSVTGRLLIRLIKQNISLYSAHTNLDTTKGGVNDALAQKLGLTNVEELFTIGFEGSARMGNIKEQTLGAFVDYVRNMLNSTVIKCIGDKSKQIKKIAVCGGSGGHMIDGALQNGCDAIVVGEAKYSDEQKAYQLGLGLIEAGHFETETIVCEEIAQRLKAVTDNVKIIVSKRRLTYYE
ncbi:MAG: Nif3-like dinuclear metal center hexameric protein [Clostridiaceae bacterium]|nr:Nif3-like dinuclear metal center hexameric protein [Clostridiaceae bacterium]